MVVKGRRYKETKHIMTKYANYNYYCPSLLSWLLLLFTLDVSSFYILSLYTACNFRRFVHIPCPCPYVHMSMDGHMDMWTWIYGLSGCPLTRWRILVPYIPFYVYDCNRPLASILRQKLVLPSVWCLFTADDCCLQDRNTWNTFPGSGLNIYWTIQTLNKRIESNIESNKSTDENWIINDWQ
jgi:hypothetical protein